MEVMDNGERPMVSEGKIGGVLIYTDNRAENRRMNESVLGKRLRGRLKVDSW